MIISDLQSLTRTSCFCVIASEKPKNTDYRTYRYHAADQIRAIGYSELQRLCDTAVNSLLGRRTFLMVD